jgi:hypothetical protein
MIGIAAGVLGGALLAASLRADQTAGQRMTGPSAERTTRETVVVTGIDRTTRNVMLQNAEGEKRTVKVPAEVKAFDTLKVGDRVDIDYYESLAVSVLPPGSKPSMSQRSSGIHMGEGGGASRQREMTVAAEIVSVDVAAHKVTFKGPNGQLRTVTAEDPTVQKRLPNLKPGQVVQFTYTEAVAASIRPAASAR